MKCFEVSDISFQKEFFFCLKEAKSENWCEIFEIGSEFGEPDGTPPSRILRSTPTGTWDPFSKGPIINGPGKLFLFSQDRSFSTFPEKNDQFAIESKWTGLLAGTLAFIIQILIWTSVWFRARNVAGTQETDPWFA